MNDYEYHDEGQDLSYLILEKAHLFCFEKAHVAKVFFEGLHLHSNY